MRSLIIRAVVWLVDFLLFLMMIYFIDRLVRSVVSAHTCRECRPKFQGVILPPYELPPCDPA